VPAPVVLLAMARCSNAVSMRRKIVVLGGSLVPVSPPPPHSAASVEHVSLLNKTALNCINLSVVQEVTISRVQDEPRADNEEHREKIIVANHDALLFLP
jgi:hypothetical protein